MIAEKRVEKSADAAATAVHHAKRNS